MYVRREYGTLYILLYRRRQPQSIFHLKRRREFPFQAELPLMLACAYDGCGKCIGGYAGECVIIHHIEFISAPP